MTHGFRGFRNRRCVWMRKNLQGVRFDSHVRSCSCWVRCSRLAHGRASACSCMAWRGRMTIDLTPIAAVLMLGFVLAWPALLAVWRRGVNREASEVASALEIYAADARRAASCPEIDPSLAVRMARLRLPELGA